MDQWIRIAVNDLYFMLDPRQVEQTLGRNDGAMEVVDEIGHAQAILELLRNRIRVDKDLWVVGHRALPDPTPGRLKPQGGATTHWFRSQGVYYLAELPQDDGESPVAQASGRQAAGKKSVRSSARSRRVTAEQPTQLSPLPKDEEPPSPFPGGFRGE